MRIPRPVLSFAVVMLATIVFAAILRSAELSLGRTDRISGYTLLGVCCVLLLLPLRKLTVLVNWGRVATWQQIHHFAGLFAIVAYLFHAGLQVNGHLETALAILFGFVSFSGLGHWYFNRRIPKLMRAAGEPLRREELHPQRVQLAKQAYAVAIAAAGDSRSACLAEFYSNNLTTFFHKNRSISYFLKPNVSLRRRLQTQLEAFARYLDEAGQSAKQTLSELVQRRDDLDFQSAMMLRIRLWNFTHVTITWCFVVVTLLHVYAVTTFYGS